MLTIAPQLYWSERATTIIHLSSKKRALSFPESSEISIKRNFTDQPICWDVLRSPCRRPLMTLSIVQNWLKTDGLITLGIHLLSKRGPLITITYKRSTSLSLSLSLYRVSIKSLYNFENLLQRQMKREMSGNYYKMRRIYLSFLCLVWYTSL